MRTLHVSEDSTAGGWIAPVPGAQCGLGRPGGIAGRHGVSHFATAYQHNGSSHCHRPLEVDPLSSANFKTVSILIISISFAFNAEITRQVGVEQSCHVKRSQAKLVPQVKVAVSTGGSKRDPKSALLAISCQGRFKR
ncbi:hypothetical protein ACK9YZ_31235 [Rhizobium sp. ZK1]|uniref:hypothetical protein n=1 Tax=Rhizobium sp. ZK1 TaxID=3389872 RepID=UPI0039F6E380